MSVLQAYMVGVVGIAALALAWLAVQRAWLQTFPEASSDPDPLAQRRGCGSCEHTEICERPQADAAGGVGRRP